jgi:N12 class adenine-specific DNA methylase
VPSGREERLQSNLDAIRLLKKLEAEDRSATEAEQQTLASYSGFSLDRDVFNQQIAVYRQYSEEFRNQFEFFRVWEATYGKWYDALREVLTDEEWQHSEVRARTKPGLLTPPALSHLLWGAVTRMGWNGESVLDGACGVGWSFGAMPQEARGARLLGVESDQISARIAAKLFPGAQIERNHLALSALAGRNEFGAVVGVSPWMFMSGDDAPQVAAKAEFPIELSEQNYCIARSLSALAPGGCAVMVVTAATMDRDPEQRAYLAEKADLVGALRIPAGVFGNDIGVADILFLRKPDGGLRNGESWATTIPVEVEASEAFGNERVVWINEYFVRHPERVLGRNSLHGRAPNTLEKNNDLWKYCLKFDENEAALLSKIGEAIQGLPLKRSLDERHEDEQVDGQLVVQAGAVMVVRHGAGLEPAPWRTGLVRLPRLVDTQEEADALAGDYIAVRDAYRALLSAELTEAEGVDALRADLNRTYDVFFERWGALNSVGAGRLLDGDPDFGSVLGIEVPKVVSDGSNTVEYVKGPIFFGQTMVPRNTRALVSTAEEAILISLDVKGRIDEAFCAQLMDVPANNFAEVRKQLLGSGLVFEDPETGLLTTREAYLSGNVVAKLAAARRAVDRDPRYLPNVMALEEVQPKEVEIDQISVVFGAPWIPAEVVSEFVTSEVGASPIDCQYVPGLRRWSLPQKAEFSSAAQARYGTERASVREVVETALGQGRITIRDNGEYNAKETAKANQRVSNFAEAFVEWLALRDEQKRLVQAAFNRSFNAIKAPQYSGAHLTFPGLAAGMIPRPHQRQAVSRMLQEQSGVIAHEVGFGKTLTLIVTAMESRRLGLAKKPLIVCDNASYPQFVATARQLYPLGRFLTSRVEDMGDANRDRFLTRAASSNWDVIFMAQSHFDRIPHSPETEIKFLSRQIEELRDAKRLLSELGGRSPQQRGITKALATEEQKLLNLVRTLNADQKDSGVCWEDMGVDLLLVDECHRYKKVPFQTAHRRLKGVDATSSQRGERMLKKAMELQGRRQGRGVILASATPVTNTLAEAWNMVRLSRPQSLRDFNVPSFDAFVAAFAKKVTSMELNEATMTWRNVDRLAKFVNGPAFVQFVRSACDVQMDGKQLALDLPKLKSGAPELRVVPLSTPTANILAGLSSVYERYESAEKKDQLSFVPIMLLQVGAAASIDPRLVSASAPDDPKSVVNRAVKEVVSIYKSTAPNGTQLLFLDRYNRMDCSALDGLSEDFDAWQPAIEDLDTPSALSVDVVPSDWNLYDDIKAKLVASGIPANEVAAVTDAKDDAERRALFAKVNSGEVRVLIGSTQRLGTGVNVQRNLTAVHHLDPARDLTPASMRQRNGRILRAGNTNEEVQVIYYGMKDTVTPGIFDRLNRKAGFINQVFSGKGVGLEFDDAAELHLEDMKAALVSDRRQLQRAELLADLRDARMKVELAEESLGDLRTRISRGEERVRILKEMTLPRVQATADWVREHVRPLDVWGGVAVPGTLLFRAGDIDLDASPKEVTKVLDSEIARWKREPAPNPGSPLVAVMHLNGMEMWLSKDSSESGEHKSDTKLVVEVPDPLNPNGRLGMPGRFGATDTLYKIARARYDFALSQPEECQRTIRHLEGDVAAFKAQIEAMEGPDIKRVHELEEELERLERDMRENPASRKPAKAKKVEPEIAVRISAGAVV